MKRLIFFFSIFSFLFVNILTAEENIMILKLKDGDVKIELFSDVAPNHVNRIKHHLLMQTSKPLTTQPFFIHLLGHFCFLLAILPYLWVLSVLVLKSNFQHLQKSSTSLNIAHFDSEHSSDGLQPKYEPTLKVMELKIG